MKFLPRITDGLVKRAPVHVKRAWRIEVGGGGDPGRPALDEVLSPPPTPPTLLLLSQDTGG